MSDEPATEPSNDLDLTYGQALEELEELIDELEGADIDVDHLAARVARGVELVRFCRARLDVVTTDVEAVVSELATVEVGPHGVGAEDEDD